MIYDYFPSLHVVFTGSFILDIYKGSDDLSRRALSYVLQGLSFREYLNMLQNLRLPVYSFEAILANKVELLVEHPLPLFKKYLQSDTKGMRALQKIEKVYLNNTNLIYGLANNEADIGNVRETFFLNQMSVNHSVLADEKADFVIDRFVFEVGGKTKIHKQIKGLKNAFVVKDDIEFGGQNVLPLWTFGFNY